MLTVAVPKRNKLPNIIVLTPKDGEGLAHIGIWICTMLLQKRFGLHFLSKYSKIV